MTVHLDGMDAVEFTDILESTIIAARGDVGLCD